MIKTYNPLMVNQIKEEKKNGVLNSELMRKYNLSYAELQFILKGESESEKEN